MGSVKLKIESRHVCGVPSPEKKLKCFLQTFSRKEANNDLLKNTAKLPLIKRC
jgi:hypothetical protein